MQSLPVILLIGFLFCSCAKNSSDVCSDDAALRMNEMRDTAKLCFTMANLCYSGNTLAVQKTIAESAETFPCRDILAHLLEKERFDEAADMLSLIWAHDLIMDYSTPRATPHAAFLDEDEVELIESSKVIQRLKITNCEIFQVIDRILKAQKEEAK